MPEPHAALAHRAGLEELNTGGLVGKDSPAAGEDAAVVLDAARQRVLLYGGKGDDDVNRNELWSFDLEARRWELVSTEGPAPPPREDHTLVIDEENDALVLYGGEDGESSRDTWTFDLRTNRWTEITDESAPYREGHAAIYDAPGRRMIVFGGNREKKLEDEVWSLDLDRGSRGYGSWSLLPTSEPGPGPRRDQGAAYDSARRRLLVFGGWRRSKESLLGDTWALDLSTLAWHEIETHGDRPPRIRHTVVGYDPRTDEMTVFGGEVLPVDEEDDAIAVDRIWTLDLGSGRWADRTPYPRSVYDHVGLFVPDYGGTLVYGGSSYRPEKEHSTWLIRENELPAVQAAAR